MRSSSSHRAPLRRPAAPPRRRPAPPRGRPASARRRREGRWRRGAAPRRPPAVPSLRHLGLGDLHVEVVLVAPERRLRAHGPLFELAIAVAAEKERDARGAEVRRGTDALDLLLVLTIERVGDPE